MSFIMPKINTGFFSRQTVYTYKITAVKKTLKTIYPKNYIYYI